MHDDAKGKRCPACDEPLSALASQFVRVCSNGKCAAVWPWELKPGQKPLMGSSRDRRGASGASTPIA